MLKHPHFREKNDPAGPRGVTQMRREKHQPFCHYGENAQAGRSCFGAYVESRVMVRLPADERAVNHDDGVVVVAHQLAGAFQ